MDIDLYKSFLAIYDTGSFTRAAREVGRTQSAISQQIRRLEETLGRPLFTRAAGSVELTEYGKSLLGFARDIVETHAEALATLQPGSFQGLVVLGIPDGLREAGHAGCPARIHRSLSRSDHQHRHRRLAGAGAPHRRRLGRSDLPDRRQLADARRQSSSRTAWSSPVPRRATCTRPIPLPLAVWDERAFDHRLMIEALEATNRRYRIACICRSVYGKHAAITWPAYAPR